VKEVDMSGKIIMLGMVAALVPVQGAAQAQCTSYGAQAQHLADAFGETVVAVGTLAGGAILEVFAAADGSTWTLVLRPDADRACLVGAGTDWMPMQGFPARPERRS